MITEIFEILNLQNDNAFYATGKDYFEKWFGDYMYSAFPVWIDIPKEFEPKDSLDGIRLTYEGQEYRLCDVLACTEQVPGELSPMLHFPDTADGRAVFIRIPYDHDLEALESVTMEE